MKALISTAALLLSNLAFANTQTVFEGVEHVSGLKCKVSVTVQNEEQNLVTVTYETEKRTLHFYNETLAQGQKIETQALFKKNGRNFETIIGAPILALGSYHDVFLGETKRGFVVHTEIKVAAIFGWMMLSKKGDFCESEITSL